MCASRTDRARRSRPARSLRCVAAVARGSRRCVMGFTASGAHRRVTGARRLSAARARAERVSAGPSVGRVNFRGRPRRRRPPSGAVEEPVDPFGQASRLALRAVGASIRRAVPRHEIGVVHLELGRNSSHTPGTQMQQDRREVRRVGLDGRLEDGAQLVLAVGDARQAPAASELPSLMPDAPSDLRARRPRLGPPHPLVERPDQTPIHHLRSIGRDGERCKPCVTRAAQGNPSGIDLPEGGRPWPGTSPPGP